MGRNKKPASQRKSKEIRIYLTPGQYRAIKNAAGQRELSQWARDELLTISVKA